MPTAVPPHPVPAGPLAVRWLAHDLPEFRAGTTATANVEVENAGSAAWEARPQAGINVSYHWLDRLGNAIVWAGIFTPVPEPIAPGETAALAFPVLAPMPPGRYRLAIDLVDEKRFWFAELGNEPLEVDVDVLPRVGRRALAVHVEDGPPELVEATRAALQALEEPVVEGEGEATAFLAAGCEPSPDWSRRILDAHEEGYAAVGGSVELAGGLLERRRARQPLEPWTPGFGRVPDWELPLLCPSIVAGVLPDAAWAEPVAGLPALDPQRLEDAWLCDGRIRVSVPVRALRPAGRRSA